MYYYDGYWYYVTNNAVKKNNIQGTEESIILEGTGLEITGIEDGVLKITSNGEEKQVVLGNSTVTTVPTATVQPITSTKGVAINNTNTKKQRLESR